MADFKRVILLDSIKPSQFFLEDEPDLEIAFVKSDFENLEKDVYSTEERTLYSTLNISIKDIQVRVIESYKYDPYDIVYVLDSGQLYKVYIF